jgi:ABC-type lipoprotein release transport system permease subunit
MLRYLEIAHTGLTALLLHPQRALVTTACLVALLLPYLVGLGLARGIEDEAAAAVRYGADLYVTGEQFGRTVPLPREAATAIRRLPGVADVIPRIVGRIELGKDRLSAVVVGVPLEGFPAGLECVEGRLYGGSRRNELVVGSDLARRLNLQVGSLLPPFYHSRSGERVSEVVGVFRSDVSIWQARVIVTSLDTAAHVFDQPDLATDLLVYCRPGYQDEVRRAIPRQGALGATVRARVLAREDVAALLPQGPLRREGIFTLLFVLAFAVGILVILVTTGFGLSERRHEIGILKALGWQTDEVMLRSLSESALIALAGASLAIVAAVFWLKGLNGYGIAGVFLVGVDRAPGFQVPFRLTPVPALLGFGIAFVLVMTGSLYSTWRAATAPPREALR